MPEITDVQDIRQVYIYTVIYITDLLVKEESRELTILLRMMSRMW